MSKANDLKAKVDEALGKSCKQELRAIDGETFKLIGDRSKEKNKLSDMKLF